MPAPTGNNAVAYLPLDRGEGIFYSFSGLGYGKTNQDIHSRAYAYDTREGQWQRLPEVPGNKNRLASIAATVDDKIYVFGGYTVAEDHSEVSTPETYILNTSTNQWQRGPDMPIPVDDSIALVYQNRYIYLVSGWHNSGNVQDVQVLDTGTMTWAVATAFPGNALFGHAGGIVGNKILVLDGVKVLNEGTNQRTYGLSNDAFVGTINPDDPTDISWQQSPPHPGPALYRAAAAGDENMGKVIIAGGSNNPYNYNGTGYDKNPSEPEAAVLSFDMETLTWAVEGALPLPTMDHRGLIKHQDRYYTIGGLEAGQKVSDHFGWFKLPTPNSSTLDARIED